MAIFGKADAGLPLVTQLIQVDLDNDGEVQQFWNRTVEHAQLALGNRAQAQTEQEFEVLMNGNKDAWEALLMGLSAEEKAANMEEIRNVILRGAAEKEFQEMFKEACMLGQEIFKTLYERQAVPYEKLMKLRALYSERNQLEPMWTEANLETMREGDEIYLPLKGMFPSRTYGVNSPAFYIASQIEEGLNDIWYERTFLAACAECKNVFLVTRTGQTYCSHRCANRNGLRRRRAKQK